MSGLEFGRYRDQEGARYCLIQRGRKWLRLVWIESNGVAVHRLSMTDERRITPIPDYPIRKAARTMTRAGRSLGITKEARTLLTLATRS